MMRVKLCTIFLFVWTLLSRSALGQTTVVGDAWVAGRLAVGTSTGTTRFEARASSTNAVAFQVSGVDGTPFLYVSSGGQAGAGLVPSAKLDINGSADSGAAGLELRSGAMYPSAGTYQMTFGYNGTANERHALRTVHSTSAANGSMDFLLWRTADAASAVGSLEALSLVVVSTGLSVHIHPAGTPDVALEVSDGNSTGGGTVHRAAETAPSSRKFKSDVRYLEPEEGARAYEDVKALKHATFRYMSFNKKKGVLVRDKRQTMRRGLIYEDAPESVRGAGESVVIDERVNNAELAMRELIRRLEAAEAEASGMQAGGKP